MSGHSIIERNLLGFTRALSNALISERIAKQPGLLQRLDPRVRVVGMLLLVISVTLCRRIPVIAALFIGAVVLGLASGVSPTLLAKRVWIIVLGFTGVIALPALFVTPGPSLWNVPETALMVSSSGLQTAALLILRVETAATITTLLVLSTPWIQVLKALRSLRVPAEVITIMAMTHRYIFLLIETASQMFESRQSRTVGVLSGAEWRRMTARTAGVLLSKSVDLSNDVYLAMQARGFRGEIYLLTDFRMRSLDYAAMMIAILGACAIVWMGR